MEESVAFGLTFLLLLGHALFLNRDVVFVGKIAQGFGVGVMLVIHDEANGIARLATSEAFVYAFTGGDIERGGLLVVEGAAANVVGSSLFERDKFTNNLLYTSGIHDALYGLLVYHFGLQRYKKKTDKLSVCF